MKRVWAAGILLAVVLGISVAGLIASDRIIGQMQEEIGEVRQALAAEEVDVLRAHNDALQSLWEKHYSLLCTYIAHEKLEQVGQSLAVLSTNLDYEEYAQFSMELNRAESQLEHLKDTEFPKLENIL